MDPNELRQEAAKMLAKAEVIQSMLDDPESEMSDKQREKQEGEYNSLIEQVKAKKAEAKQIEEREAKAAERRQGLEDLRDSLEAPASPRPAGDPNQLEQPKNHKIVIPATAKRYGSVRNFKTEEQAYGFGMWCLAAAGNTKSRQWCQNNGVLLKQDHTEGVNSTGGFLVPEQYENDLIDLREQYGVFRREARIRPMTSDTRTDPRRTGGLTAYFIGENSQGTKSTKSWDRVGLTAKKLMVLSLYTNELNEDAVINIGDDLAEEIAYAFSLKEDQCGFNGDGTSGFGGIQGITTKFEADANLAGHLTPGAGDDTFEELAIEDFTKCIATLPQYATPNAKWYISQYGWAQAMSRLKYSAGGSNRADLEEGSAPRFMGFPVVVSQVLAGAGDQTGVVMAMFGDLTRAASMGDRRGTAIEFSRDATVDGKSAFEYDAIGIRGTERFDINVHDIGDDTDAGPVVALVGAS